MKATSTKISAEGTGYGWMADWGFRQWANYLLDILLEGDSVTTEMVMQYLLGRSQLFHRLDPRMSSQIPLDDVSAISELVDLGHSVDLKETLQFVDENFKYEDLKAEDHTMITNSLDNATNYHDAWMHNVSYIYKE